MINSPNLADINRDNSASDYPLKTFVFFLVLSAILSFLYFEIVMPRGAHFPLAIDAYQYLGSYEGNFKNGGRWFNYLTFDLIAALPKRLAYYLDLLTTAVLWLCFLRPKRTIHHILLFSILLLVILSSHIMFSVRFWPGGRIMTNLVALMAVLVIHSNIRLIVKLPLILLAVLAIGGGYQFHHMMLILAFISASNSITFNWKSFVLITGLWIIGFVAAYIFADLLVTLKFGEGRASIRGYRQLDSAGGHGVSTLFSNVDVISRSMFRSFFKTTSKYPIFYIGPFLMVIGAVIGIRHMSIPKDALFRVLWWSAPILSIIVILAVANHRFYPRLNLSSLMAIIVGLWILSYRSPLAMKSIILGSVLLLISQTLQNMGNVRLQDSSIDQSLKLIDPIRQDASKNEKSHLIVLDLGSIASIEALNFKKYNTYFVDILGVDRLTYCNKTAAWTCARFDGFQESLNLQDLCRNEKNYHKQRQGNFLILYIFDRKICSAS